MILAAELLSGLFTRKGECMTTLPLASLNWPTRPVDGSGVGTNVGFAASWDTRARCAATPFQLRGLKVTDRAVSIRLGTVPGVSAMRPLQRLGSHPGLCRFWLLLSLIDELKATVLRPS
jgi:hypothetical protein